MQEMMQAFETSLTESIAVEKVDIRPQWITWASIISGRSAVVLETMLRRTLESPMMEKLVNLN
jgi:hypothetical protein